MDEMTESIPKLQGHNFKVYELLNSMCEHATPKGTDGLDQKKQDLLDMYFMRHMMSIFDSLINY